MRRLSSNLVLAATDLSGFFECEHKAVLELAVVERTLERPGQNELERKLLEQRGIEHERRVLDFYRNAGLSVTTVSQRPRSDVADLMAAARETDAAMAAGSDVVSQGVLFDGAWLGRPDFLVRQDGHSRFGNYFYEVVDAKLARHAKASAVLQLCAYTDQLARVQQHEPEHLSLALGNEDITPTRLRTADYMAFYRQAKRSLEVFTDGDSSTDPYPEPVEHCGVCPWWRRCEERRRQDDRLTVTTKLEGIGPRSDQDN